ncbi:MAG: SRPBCC family protein [Dehalococcoidales bacterium]|nr:SRPBCC family protein [Dehalococcoidales bacterium]
MAKIEHTVIINRPVDPVFDYATNIDNLPKWETNMLESAKTSEKSKGIGTTYKGVIKAMGMTMDWTSKVTDFEENTRVDKTINSGKTIIYEKLLFDETNDGNTEFNLMQDYRIGGFLRLITPIMLFSMKQQMKKNLANLKRIMETEGEGS